MKGSIYWDVTPCSTSKLNRNCIGTCSSYVVLLTTCFKLVSCLSYSSALKMEAIYSSETSIGVHRTIRRYIPIDRTFQNL
jgi:hypothetical protein